LETNIGHPIEEYRKKVILKESTEASLNNDVSFVSGLKSYSTCRRTEISGLLPL
jgi:hypothetical protein